MQYEPAKAGSGHEVMLTDLPPQSVKRQGVIWPPSPKSGQRKTLKVGLDVGKLEGRPGVNWVGPGEVGLALVAGVGNAVGTEVGRGVGSF